MKRLFICVLLLLFSSVGFVNAGTITQTEHFSGIPNYSSILTFDKYDPLAHSGSTLLSIEISMYLEISGGQLTVDNDGSESASIDVELGAKANITSSVPLTNLALQPIFASDLAVWSGDHFDLAPDNGDGSSNNGGYFDPTGPDAATFLGQNVDDSASDFVNTLVFSQYMGSDTFDITVGVDQILDFGGNGGVEGAFTPVDSSGYLSVIYTFDDIPEVPEPASLFLFGLGILGFAGGIRKKIKR